MNASDEEDMDVETESGDEEDSATGVDGEMESGDGDT